MEKSFSIYNTMSKQIEEFKPLEPGKVGIYVCGITPYDFSHIGHARCAVVYDTLIKFLRKTNWQVKHVQNYTDIDDKIIKRSIEKGMDPIQLAKENIKAYEEDMATLNVAMPDVAPKVSTHIHEIVDFVKRLEDKGFTYIHPNGDVMYDTAKFNNYGCLSNRNLDEQIDGIRISEEGKKDPKDFVLWKMAKDTENIAWPSPWGRGRPGWHIECSAMADKHLGDKFDIHGGGLDLMFPHHENEVAQSDACHSHKTVSYWMHTGLIKVDNEKMSKSLGNFFLIRDVLSEFSGETIRLFLLGTNYNTSLNFSKEALTQAKNALERLQNTLARMENVNEGFPITTKMENFYNNLAKNLNTPTALANLFEISKEINTALNQNKDVADLKATMLEMAYVLGLLQQKQAEVKLSFDVDSIIAQIKQARENKDWATADNLRDHLKQNGVELQIGAGNTYTYKVVSK